MIFGEANTNITSHHITSHLQWMYSFEHYDFCVVGSSLCGMHHTLHQFADGDGNGDDSTMFPFELFRSSTHKMLFEKLIFKITLLTDRNENCLPTTTTALTTTKSCIEFCMACIMFDNIK